MAGVLDGMYFPDSTKTSIAHFVATFQNIFLKNSAKHFDCKPLPIKWFALTVSISSSKQIGHSPSECSMLAFKCVRYFKILKCLLKFSSARCFVNLNFWYSNSVPNSKGSFVWLSIRSLFKTFTPLSICCKYFSYSY